MKALFLLLLVSGSALADDAALLRCRGQADGASRLACYDAIQLGAPMPAASAAVGTVAVQPAAVSRKELEQNFGMEAVKAPVKLDEIDSSIVGQFDGWRPNQQIKLANGQVWRVVDGSEGITPLLDNPKVKIVRGTLGSMYLEIDGTNRSPKVRRVQ
ncbi:MAG: hypothetical protein V4724_13790 [Pseudomonadota bacterium]